MHGKPLNIAGEPITPELLLRLQQQAGNQAVLKIIRAARKAAATEQQPLESDVGGSLPTEIGTTWGCRDEYPHSSRLLGTQNSNELLDRTDRPPSELSRELDWRLIWQWLVRVLTLSFLHRQNGSSTDNRTSSM